MDTDDGGPVGDGPGDGGGGAEESAGGLGLAGDASNETLPRSADNHRAAEGEQLALAADQLEVVVDVLPEADARIDQGPGTFDARRLGGGETLAQELGR